MFFTPGNHKEHGLTHNPFNAIVAPRPIGWISTIGKDGKTNLAPYSYFNALSAAPPVVGFSAAQAPGGGVKDSLANVRATECFAVNVVSKAQMEAMNLSSAALPHGESEFAHAGLEAEACEVINAPRVKGAPCHLECVLVEIVAMPQTPGGTHCHFVIGEVVGIHIDAQYIRDGRLDVTLYNPVSRLGYMDYAVVDSLIEMNRPK